MKWKKWTEICNSKIQFILPIRPIFPALNWVQSLVVPMRLQLTPIHLWYHCSTAVNCFELCLQMMHRWRSYPMRSWIWKKNVKKNFWYLIRSRWISCLESYLIERRHVFINAPVHINEENGMQIRLQIRCNVTLVQTFSVIFFSLNIPNCHSTNDILTGSFSEHNIQHKHESNLWLCTLEHYFWQQIDPLPDHSSRLLSLRCYRATSTLAIRSNRKWLQWNSESQNRISQSKFPLTFKTLYVTLSQNAVKSVARNFVAIFYKISRSSWTFDCPIFPLSLQPIGCLLTQNIVITFIGHTSVMIVT